VDQRPPGPKDLDCPFWRKSMAKVCHRCPLWTRLQMQHPQSGERLDKWDCAVAWAVVVGVETGHRTNQLAAVVEDARNTVAGAMDDVAAAARLCSASGAGSPGGVPGAKRPGMIEG
jgi:hypothetical protein